MRDNFARYEAAGAKVYGVNPGSEASHDKYCALFGFQFPLIVDQGSQIARAFGATKVGGIGIQRSVFIVADGRIRYAKAGAPGSEEILGALT